MIRLTLISPACVCRVRRGLSRLTAVTLVVTSLWTVATTVILTKGKRVAFGAFDQSVGNLGPKFMNNISGPNTGIAQPHCLVHFTDVEPHPARTKPAL